MEKNVAFKISEQAQLINGHLNTMAAISKEDMAEEEFKSFRHKIAVHMADVFDVYMRPIFKEFPDIAPKEFIAPKKQERSPEEIEKFRQELHERSSKIIEERKRREANGIKGENMKRATAIKITARALASIDCLSTIVNIAKVEATPEESAAYENDAIKRQKKIHDDFIAPAYRDFPDIVTG